MKAPANLAWSGVTSRARAAVLAATAFAAAAAPLGAVARAAAEDEVVVAGANGVPVPKRTKMVMPEYPAEAQSQGMRGIVILELVIDTNGKVASADVVRSVPPFDEAALAAARKWEYEVTKVNGKPVMVRLTVPITFAIKVPDVMRQEGIPELRQGASPQVPASGPSRESAAVSADVTLDSDGRIAEAEITSGESPWSEALLQALRSWRFATDGTGATISFRVEAEFFPGRGTGSRVELRLTGLRRSESSAAAAPPEDAGTGPQVAAAPSPPPPGPGAEPSPSPGPTPAATPEPDAGSERTGASERTEPPAVPSPPAAPPDAPAAPPREPAPSPAATPSPKPPVEIKPPPPMEVITAPPPRLPLPSDPQDPVPAPTPPPQPGFSAVRDVALSIGVPDLTKGRRPVVPPLARMSGASGHVEVRFSVDAAGQALVREASGPDLLKVAAEQTVGSWVFRRTSAERLFLVAVFDYKGDTVAASVKPES